MIRAEFRVPQSLHRFLDCLKPAGRHHLYSAAAAAVSNLVRRHIAADAPRRHSSSQFDDGTGQRTGFMEKAARKTVFHADANHGEVVIPSPGFGRAFHDVEIVPTHGAALTIPISSHAYGHRVKELRSMGWIIFSPKKSEGAQANLGKLMGYGPNGEQAIPLYVLKRHVRQAQDRSLLPSDAAISTTASRAMLSEINRISKAA